MKKGDKPKPLEAYEHTKPVQLSLFEALQSEGGSYSNTIELYDFIPKYHWGNVKRENDKYLPTLEREFECRGVRYTVKIDPARIDDKDGIRRDYYPGQREEIVEQALRKLACDGNGVFLDDHASVTFTLYELHQELKRMGHGYDKNQIKEALQICKRTNLIVTSEDGNTILESNMFETLGLQSKEQWRGEGKKTRCFVRFNTLVTTGINKKLFARSIMKKIFLSIMLSPASFTAACHIITRKQA